MGIAGPITSAVIGLVLLAIAAANGWSPEAGMLMPATETPLLAMLVWLGYINIMLAVFNMIPGFPLDGGRVLRAVLWWTTGDADRATRTAARTGQLVAFGFIALGILQFFGGAGFGGLWIAFIGWFLLDAARASYAQVAITESLRGVRVGDVMETGCEVVEGSENLQSVVDDHLLRTGRRCFLVVDDGRVAGLLTPHEIKGVERTRWRATPAESVMRPLEELRTVEPDTPVLEALEAMGRDNVVNQLPVISGGRLEGMISRGHLMRLLEARAELSM
jgi:CBS domain-containing protein